MSNKIITIGREFGSGGHEIGEKLSKILNIPLYDRELITLASEKMGVDPKHLMMVDETALRGFLSTYRAPDITNSTTGYGMPINDSMYITQCEIIEKLAHAGPCIIIGRCADDVLQNFADCVNVFFCASLPYKVRRITEKYKCTEKEAVDMIHSIDKKRKNYYEAYTSKKWGGPESHQLLINVSLLGQEKAVETVKNLYYK